MKRDHDRLAPAVYKVDQAAKRLGVRPPEVVALIEDGTLHALNIGGGKHNHWRIFIASVDRLIAKRKAAKGDLPAKARLSGRSAKGAELGDPPLQRAAMRCSDHLKRCESRTKSVSKPHLGG